MVLSKIEDVQGDYKLRSKSFIKNYIPHKYMGGSYGRIGGKGTVYKKEKLELWERILPWNWRKKYKWKKEKADLIEITNHYFRKLKDFSIKVDTKTSKKDNIVSYSLYEYIIPPLLYESVQSEIKASIDGKILKTYTNKGPQSLL